MRSAGCYGDITMNVEEIHDQNIKCFQNVSRTSNVFKMFSSVVTFGLFLSVRWSMKSDGCYGDITVNVEEIS